MDVTGHKEFKGSQSSELLTSRECWSYERRRRWAENCGGKNLLGKDDGLIWTYKVIYQRTYQIDRNVCPGLWGLFEGKDSHLGIIIGNH